MRITEIGNFVARFEGLISSNFILAGIVKISLCLLAAARGVKALFCLDDHKAFVLPCGILAMALCSILYKNLMDMFAFINYYFYYAFPFQVLIPFIIFIAGEIHCKRQKGKALPLPAPEES